MSRSIIPTSCFGRTLVLLVAGLMVGCGGNDGPPRYSFSGTVTYDGKPVPAGIITVEPDADKNNTGPQTRIEFKDGTFETADDQGAISGPVKIRIQGFDGMPDEEKALPMGMPLFDDYQTTLELPEQESTEKFEIPKQE